MTMNTSNHPWPCAIHNPDNLTPEQFGDPKVWRPATPDETADVPHEVWHNDMWYAAAVYKKAFKIWSSSYRIRLSDRPWPVAKPAEFPPPPVGHEWHNPGGMPADKLLEGWRLLVKQEVTNKAMPNTRCYYPGWLAPSCVCTFTCSDDCTILVPATTPFPPADLTDADPCPKEAPCGWVEVTSGVVQKHDYLYFEKAIFSDWAQNLIGDKIEYDGVKIYRHPARMPKAEEKADSFGFTITKERCEKLAVMGQDHTISAGAFSEPDEPNNPQNVNPRHIPSGYRLARKSEMDGKYNHSARAWSLTGERFVPVPGCFMEPSWTVVVPDSVHWQARAEKAEPELPGVEHHMRNSEPFDLQSRAEKAEAALDASRADWHRLNALLCESNDRVGKLEAELAALKLRKIGVLLPIVEPLPPVPDGCMRVFGNADENVILTNALVKSDAHYADLILPTPPDKRAEFEAMWKKGAAAQLDWNREEDGQFTCELIERAFQHWLNAGGDK